MRLKPYIRKQTENGKIAKPAFKRKEYKRPGVYIIRIDKKPVYVGSSLSNVYKTLYRHFQSWPDKKQRRVTYSKFTPGLTVEVKKLPVDKVKKTERDLLLKYNPIDNKNKIRTLFEQDMGPIDYGDPFAKYQDIEAPF